MCYLKIFFLVCRRLEAEVIREAANSGGDIAAGAVVQQVRDKLESSGLPQAISLMRGVNALRQAYDREKKKLMGWNGAIEKQWRTTMKEDKR